MIKKSLISLFLVYLGAALLLYFIQDKLLFHPSPENNRYTGQTKIFTKTFNNQNLNIKTYVLNPGFDSALIYFGGNGETVSLLSKSFQQIIQNHTIYLVDYRGYGGSDGEPTEQALFSDALHIYDQIQSQYKDISVIGRSLGSAVAVYLAAQRQVTKLALITPFDSILSIAEKRFPIFPVGLIINHPFNSLQYARQIKAELLVLIAETDRVVPRENTEHLLQQLPQAYKVYVTGTNHNNIGNSLEYKQSLSAFFK